jgi:predicted DNA-binding protein with PD1-like motif
VTLEQILKEIEVQRGFMNADIAPEVIQGKVPPQEMARVAALEIAKRQSKDRIEELRNQYDRQVLKSAAVVLAYGGTTDVKNAFVKAASDEDALCVDADALYKNIAANAETILSGARVMSASVSQYIVEAVAKAIGQLAPNQFEQYPRLPAQYVDTVVSSSEELLAIIKAVAKPCTQVPLSVTWLERNVANLAFQKGFSEEPLPVVVIVGDEAELPLWKSYFMAGAPRITLDLSVDSVEEQLESAKAQLGAILGS